MARKTHDDALGVAGAETIIGTGVVIRGNLASESDIIVDGNLNGDIKTPSEVTIGVNAQIKGNVSAGNITIAGALDGNVTATGDVTIRETGNVIGDIKAAGLAVSLGAVFIGRSIMQAAPHLATDEPVDEEPNDDAPIKSTAPKDHKA